MLTLVSLGLRRVCCVCVCSWQSVDEGRTWNEVVADGGALSPADAGGRVMSAFATVQGKHVVCGGLRLGGSELASCYSLTVGLIESLTLSGISALSPPLQLGQRFDYTGVIDVPTASFRLELRLAASFSYVLNDGSPVTINSGDRVSLAAFLYGQPTASGGQQPRRTNVLQLWTPEGIYKFTLTAAPGATLPKPPTAKLHAFWANPDGLAATMMVRGVTAQGGFTDWSRTTTPLGGTFPLRWADSPSINRIEIMQTPATAKYSIAVATTGACPSGSSSTGQTHIQQRADRGRARTRH